MRVELTGRGSLILPADVAAACFGDAWSVLVSARTGELHIGAIGSRAVGGLILKRCNARGDRSVLVTEQLPHDDAGNPAWDAGERGAVWDEEARSLRVPLRIGAGVP